MVYLIAHSGHTFKRYADGLPMLPVKFPIINNPNHNKINPIVRPRNPEPYPLPNPYLLLLSIHKSISKCFKPLSFASWFKHLPLVYTIQINHSTYIYHLHCKNKRINFNPCILGYLSCTDIAIRMRLSYSIWSQYPRHVWSCYDYQAQRHEGEWH